MEEIVAVIKKVWITDDDPDDVIVFQEALTEVYPAAHLTAFSSGEALLKSLSTLPAPDLLFLDIQMPCLSGKDCLVEIRNRIHLQALPVIIYSCSPNPNDITSSYQLGATLYVQKPGKYTELLQLVKMLLSLQWGDIQTITNKQFVDGKYVPFMVQ
jgi:CheY-like chemotaxis protein